MHPIFSNFDYLFVERASYYVKDPQRGEVVVFHFPKNRSEYFIKRIVGLPGERIVVEDNQVKIIQQKEGNPFLLDERAYLPADYVTQGNVDLTLKEGEYFVLGDNRNASFDSRAWGAVPRQDIVGKVLVRIWPPLKAKAFFGKDYASELLKEQ